MQTPSVNQTGGSPKRSKIRVDDADVLDLSSSVDAAPRQISGDVRRQFVDVLEEDVEPEEGLDVRFGPQVLRAPRAADESWVIEDVR